MSSYTRWRYRLAVSVACTVCGSPEGQSCTQKEPPEGCSDTTASAESAGEGSWTCDIHPQRLRDARKKKFSRFKPFRDTSNDGGFVQ